MLRQAAAVLALSLSLLQTAAAQQTPAPPAAAETSIPEPLRARILTASTRDVLVQMLVREIRTISLGRDWVDAKDIEAVDTIMKANLRAQNVARLLSYDLDEDGVITRTEVEAHFARSLLGLADDRRISMIDQIMAADKNADGRITIEEMLQQPVPATPHFMTRRIQALLALDPDKDGRLTVAEAEALAIDAWRIADKDGDGKLSAEERAAVAGRPLPSPQPQPQAENAPTAVEIVNVPLRPSLQPLSETARRRLEEWARAGLVRPATKEDLDAWANGAGGPPDRFGRRFPPELIFAIDRTWVILGAIDLGSDFRGSDAIGLLLPAGTPLPRGVRSHGPLYRMDNFMCRGSYCPAPVPIVRSRGNMPSAQPATPKASSCRIEISPDAVVYAIGAYESKQPARQNLRGNRPGLTDIVVTDTSRPVALYLSSYESMEWRIGVAPGVKLAGIFAAGYYDQVVIGVDPAVPVVIGSRPPATSCGIQPVYGYRVAEHAASLDAVSRAVFGRDIDEFKLEYYAPPRIVIGPPPQPGQIAYSKDRGDPFAVDSERLPVGMAGVEALVARQRVRRASNAELLAWVEGYEKKNAARVVLDGPAHAWMITGAKRLPSHPGGWANIFILPAGAPEPEDSGGTWAILKLADFTCAGRDCFALLGGFRR